VRKRPPIFSCDSSTITFKPLSFNFFAAASPAIPPPITITVLSFGFKTSLSLLQDAKIVGEKKLEE
jgi:hypothetical protein